MGGSEPHPQAQEVGPLALEHRNDLEDVARPRLGAALAVGLVGSACGRMSSKTVTLHQAEVALHVHEVAQDVLEEMHPVDERQRRGLAAEVLEPLGAREELVARSRWRFRTFKDSKSICAPCRP